MKMNNDKSFKQSFGYTFLLGLIAHGYCFLNMIASHDALNNIYIAEKWTRVRAGRFFYPVYLSLVRGRIFVPWLIGILGLFWISLAVYLIVKLFQIKKNWAVFMVAAIAVTNPTVYALAASYLHDFDADMFALFLSVAAAFCWKKGTLQSTLKKQLLYFGTGALAVSVTMGIYQSFLSVTIALIMIDCFGMLLDDQNWKKVFRDGFCGILMLLFSAVFYFCEILVSSALTGISVFGNQEYNSLGNMGEALSSGIGGTIAGSYLDFFLSFWRIHSGYPGKMDVVIHGVLAVCLIGVVLWRFRKIAWQNRLMILFLAALMPMAMNFSYVLSGGLVHDLMKYAFWLVYLIALIVVLWMCEHSGASEHWKHMTKYLFAFCMLLIVLGNIQSSNTVYMKKDLEYQSTLSYMTRVAQKIEEQEEYVEGETPVLFVGEEAIGNSMSGFERFEDITGVGSSSPITFYETYEKYFKYVLNLPLNLSEDQTVAEKECVAKMPAFPKEGSIQMVDGVLVVKLEENYAED